MDVGEEFTLQAFSDGNSILPLHAVQDWNIKDKYIEEYERLDRKASPMFIEPKGYVFVGASRKRMTPSNMPSHDAVRDFGYKLADSLGYERSMEKPASRVVLLTKKPNMARIVK